MRFFSITMAAFVVTLSAQAQPRLTPGNLAVLRLGDGAQVPVNTGNTLFLDQYTTNGTIVNTTAIPDSGASALIQSGTAGSEGGLTRSANKANLALIGYNTNRLAGVKIASASAASVPRAIGTIDPAGTFALVQTTKTFFDKDNPRCVVSDGQAGFWAAAGRDGTVYFNPPTNSLSVQTTLANTRYVKIVNSNLYFSVQSGTAGIYTLTDASGQPAGLTQTTAVTNAFFYTGTNSQPSAFEINPDLTLAYVADMRATNGGGIQKWTKSNGAWTLSYTLSVGTGLGAFGVAVDFSQTKPVIYATTVETASSNRLVRIVDTGASATATLLAKAGNNRIFRGVDFTPDARPVILAQPQGQSVSSGADVAFTVTASSPYPLGYQWLKNGSPLPGATDPTLNLRSVTTTDQATYSVILSNQFAQVTSTGAVLTVTAASGPPTLKSQPQNQTNFAGGTVTLCVTASGTVPLFYQWFCNSNLLVDATNSTLVLSNLDFPNQGYYSVTVTNSLGSTNSQTAYVAVLPVPPTITFQPVPQIAREHSVATFSAAATGTGPFTWQWLYNGSPITESSTFVGTTSNLLTIANVQYSYAGQYSVSVTAPGGSTNSHAATLTVVPQPSVVVYSNAGSIYTQNFNSLPNPGTATVNSANPVTINGATYSLDNPIDLGFPVQPTGAGGLGLSNTLAGWYGLAETSSKFGASAGDQSTGGLISFGGTNSSSTNRALGLIATSSTGPTAMGVKFLNTSSMILTQINVSFVGQLWRQQPIAKPLVFGYRVAPQNDEISTNALQLLPALDVSFATNPAASGVNGPLATAPRTLTAQQIDNWLPGTALWLIWQMPDDTGSGQGLAIDDFTFSANGIPAEVTLSVALGNGTLILSWPASAVGFVLQSSSDLSAWTDVKDPVSSNGLVTAVQVPASDSAQFYRLILK